MIRDLEELGRRLYQFFHKRLSGIFNALRSLQLYLVIDEPALNFNDHLLTVNSQNKLQLKF